MNRPRELRYQAYLGILLGFLLFFFMLSMSGCVTWYSIEVCNPETLVCSTVRVLSGREFEKPNVTYSRDGDSASFTFGADKATQAGPSEYAKGARDVIGAIYGIQAQPAPVIITPIPAPEEENQ